jgi:beta-xylosidase
MTVVFYNNMGKSITRKSFLILFFLNSIFSWATQKLPLADPFILYHDNKYYAYGTSDPNGIVVYTSDDLQFWTKAPSLALHKNNSYADRWFWAPEVYSLNGQFYMYYSADEHICVATAQSPLGPFVQDIKQPMFADKAIDNSLFIDDDGSAYLFCVRFTDGNAIWMAELESDYKTIKANTWRLCFTANTSGWESDWGKIAEGPFCIKHEGYYYLTYSANHYQSHNYGVGYAFTLDIKGSWAKYNGNPVLQKPNGLVGSGHHCLFRDKDDQLKMAFHAHKSETTVNPRETYITSVDFVKPPRGMSILTVSQDYQPAYLGSNTAIRTVTEPSGAKIYISGNQFKVEGTDVQNVSLYTIDGQLAGCKANQPFSFTMPDSGLYLAVIRYQHDLQELVKVVM